MSDTRLPKSLDYNPARIKGAASLSDLRMATAQSMESVANLYQKIRSSMESSGIIEDLETLGPPSADGEFIVATGAGAFAYESGNTARKSLGLGTGDSPTFDDLTISNPSSIYALFHSGFTGYEIAQHIDHTNVSIIAGQGLTGGGNILASRTLSLHMNNNSGYIPYYPDVDAGNPMESSLFYQLNGNMGLGQTSFDATGSNVLAIANGTAPAAGLSDAIQLYSADRGGAAGKAGLHLMVEDGTEHVFSDIAIIGGTTDVTTTSQNALQILGTSTPDSRATMGRWSADAAPAQIHGVKSRNAIIGSSTIVQDDDGIFEITGYVDDGTDFATAAAAVRFQVDDASPAANQVGAEVQIKTATTGGTLTTAVIVDSGQDVVIGNVAASGQLHVDQSDSSGAQPVLYLDQADVSEEMIQFETTIGTGNAIEAVGVKSLTTTHFVKCTLPGGLTRYIPVGTIA